MNKSTAFLEHQGQVGKLLFSFPNETIERKGEDGRWIALSRQTFPCDTEMPSVPPAVVV